MRTSDLIEDFGALSYAEQQLFIQRLRKGREIPTSNNEVKQRKVKRTETEDMHSLVKALTPEQIAQLLTALGG